MSEPLEPSAIDYQSTTTPQHFSAPLLIAGSVMSAVLAALFLLVVPHFETIFKDFGTKLPAPTQLLLDVSRWFAGGGWVLLVLPIGLAWLAPLAFPAKPAERRIFTVWMILVLVMATIAIVVIAMIVLYMPMISLIQNISSPKK